MKKLLVLTLVLGLATMVSAVPSSDLSLVSGMDYTVVGSTVTILSTSPVAGFALGLIDPVPSGGTLAIGSVNPAFGIKGPGDPDPFGSGGIIGVSGAVSTTPPVYVTGMLYDFTFTGLVAGDVITLLQETNFGLGHSEVEWDDTSKTSLDGATITIPEPMTIALLGLGGLFLRRKK